MSDLESAMARPMGGTQLDQAAAALTEADRELAMSLVALLHGAAAQGDVEHPTLNRLAAFAHALRKALGATPRE
jgi:hypothetical protein